MNTTNKNSPNISYISVSQMQRILQKIGTEHFIAGIVEYLEQDFAKWESFDKSPRFAAHSPDGVIELMPIGDHEKFSFKYVNGHPKNTASGLQTVIAFGVLSDVDTGYPLLLSEMTILTALRTAATSVMMAKYLARKDSKTLALIGCGAQSEFQAIAFINMLGIKTIRLYDTDPEAIKKCYNNLKNRDVHIVLCTSAEEVVQDADIITTCTADKKNATILTSDMVTAGVHVNAIGGDCPGKTELEAKLLERADVFIEYEPQTRIEGDIQQLPEDSPVTEMFKVIRGDRDGRTSDEQITIFDGVGFAIEDYSALRYVYDLVSNNESCQQLELLASPSNPRNLYGLAMTSAE
ncbi:ornithine cyclodeaminase [Thalassotalea piscium]|uniref:Ornithine cyclodeaminase n=1 Tax=Thalassotalea piscium TaxID=1230533 RepID=A0A7X0TV11_9GAMM|nr:ornithine cyclodeaminase [Thalassotalea piscium]MBB6544952.1 ornithine cyclodeaminase [Thalassotalea piscium]